jgi:membrane protease YdiL (CAAX protease family)
MTRKYIYVAWVCLIALSFASTLLSLPGHWANWPVVTAVAVLTLAWLKVRIILSRYLGLAAAPSWRRGAEFALAMLCLLLLGLYLVPFGF